MRGSILLLACLLLGCGSEPQKPTAQEAADFRGKPISPEQKAKGMAAAMAGAGGAKGHTPR